VDRVAQALPKDSALVEFVAYEDRPLVPKPGTLVEQVPGELRYLAFVLLADGRVSAVDLGPGERIHSAVLRLRQSLIRRSATWQRASQELYRLAFKPLLPALGTTRRLALSTDGQLSLVPFAALHDGRRFLVDTFHLSYRTSGKDLLPRPGSSIPAHAAVILADPDFDSAPASPTPATPASEAVIASAERSPVLETFFSTRSAELASQPWAPLPGTREEALAIQRLLPQARLMLGAEASKQALLRLPPPGILHVATHGFFLNDTAGSPQGTRAVGQFGEVADPGPRHLPPNPLLRSGLVLAGARETAPRPAHLKDSLATALELSGMNLWGTQLVVLSACDTGQGDVKLGQGVYGLRRALGVAGAQTVVMSLWKVNDETTRELMVDYYRRLLTGLGRAAALDEAMRALREKRPHPYYWAPFAAIGADSPLEGL
jgi:CHAT domain-containing protein